MQQWWQDLNQREQRLVAAMSLVVGIFLFISLVWQPLNENLAKAQIKVQKQQQLEQWVNENLAYYKNLQRTGNSNKSNESLSSLVNRTAKNLSITIARMQPQGDNLQVWIDEVPFDHFVTWIDQLNRQEATRVLAVDLSVGNAPGTVKVRRLQVGK
ncbi:type II secretion system protein GspM [Colwelliaceae bacterium BS250]